MKHRIQLFRMTLLAAVLCMSACGKTEEIPDTEPVETEPAAIEEIPEEEGEETLSEEEQIQMVYEEGLKMTFCIFTATGSNGTGFLVNDQYVVTNAHVLYDTDEFILKDIEGNEYTGTVVFMDYETDIAVIQADGIQGVSVTFGNSDEAAPGDSLIMIGNPAEGEPFSLCTGKRAELPEDFNLQDQFIPSDANLISGYSGGPVFNLSKEVIGISNGAYMGDLSRYGLEHLSLIIPINRVKAQIEENSKE